MLLDKSLIDFQATNNEEKKKKENVIWLTIFTPTDLIESESESELPSSPSYSSWFRKHIKKVVMYLSVMSSVKDKKRTSGFALRESQRETIKHTSTASEHGSSALPSLEICMSH